MAIIKEEDIVGYWVEFAGNKILVCLDCVENDEADSANQDDIMTRDELDKLTENKDRVCCDRSNKQIED
jgi:hypothetical protein